MKLPGKLGTMTGNVLYPNDDSKLWDVDRKLCTQPEPFVKVPVPGPGDFIHLYEYCRYVGT